jgi:ABC-type glutathione transport system ATPase component
MMDYKSLSEISHTLYGELIAHARIKSSETSRLKTIESVVNTNRTDIEDYKASINLCRVCIQEQAASKEHIENIITTLLNGVMSGVHTQYAFAGDIPYYEYKLEEVIDAVGAVVGLKPTVYKNGVADDPDSFGGGVQNLIKFGSNLIHVLLNPTISPVVILDEPMTNLSPKAWKFVVRFLVDLQKDLGIQVVAITHSGAQFPDTWMVWREGQTSYVRYLEE